MTKPHALLMSVFVLHCKDSVTVYGNLMEALCAVNAPVKMCHIFNANIGWIEAFDIVVL